MALLAALPLLMMLPAQGAQPAPRARHAHAHRVCPVSHSAAVAGCFAWVESSPEGQGTAQPFVAPPYGPGALHTAYGLPTTTSGNQTIAIVDAFGDPYIESDLQDYSDFYGIPGLQTCSGSVTTSCFSVLNQQGKASPLPAFNFNWAIETSLDVEIAHGICQNCKILLIEAKNGKLANLGKAVNTAVAKGADVVSNSYGSYGSGKCASGPYNHPHVAIVVAAGDQGFKVACPAKLATTVAVGGTSLTVNAADGSYISESVWNGTGSGCATGGTAPAWQPLLSAWAAIGCGTHRGMNDVAADADPATGAGVFIFGSLSTVGGTSLSAPIIAAVYALAGNASSWAYPAQSVYGGTGLRDVTSGSNGGCPAHTLQCNGAAGFDLPTGNGTPLGLGGF